MEDKINQIKMEFEKQIVEANSMEKIEEMRVSFLGKKGKITELMQGLKDVMAEKRREVGIAINNLKQYIEGLIEGKIKEAKEIELQKDDFVITRKLAEEKLAKIDANKMAC